MFSICIPNYNYEKYLGSTLCSVFNQTCKEFEVVVADNCSTDGSVHIVKQYAEKFPSQVKYKINPVNLGFSGNLDQAAGLTTKPYMIMLSSDDTMNPEALTTYKTILEFWGTKKIIICAANDVIDAYGNILRTPRARDFRFNLWRMEDIDNVLTELIGATVFRVKPSELLKRSLLHCTNPFNFCATCYSKSLYDAVGGYGGGRMINPDKWFHWRIMSQAEDIVFVDAPLFQYRWHQQNQTAQQTNSGFLKYLVDEYRNVIEISDDMLIKSGVTKNQFVGAFIDYDIIRHGIAEFCKGRWLKSLRIFLFGWSVFPVKMLLNSFTVPYLILLLTTPLGAWVMSKIWKRK